MTDVVIVLVMVISGVLALMRGFVREVFSIISWGGSAFITLWLFPPLRATGRAVLSFVHTPWVADGVTAGLVFILSLVALSYVTTMATEKVRGGANPGPFDGTAGFIFGLARGFILVCLLYLFYGAVALPPKNAKDPEWIAHSHFLALIKVTNAQFMKLVDKAEHAIPQNPTAGKQPRIDNSSYADRGKKSSKKGGKGEKGGYSNGSRDDMDRLLSSNNGSLKP